MSEPTTAAGRTLLVRHNWTMTNDPGDARPSDAVAWSMDLADILAIEAEARTAALDEARAAVLKGTLGWDGDTAAEALAAIDALREGER